MIRRPAKRGGLGNTGLREPETNKSPAEGREGIAWGGRGLLGSSGVVETPGGE